ncbi:MAG TPA: NAD-dependent epimerase/dehydratase family protein [Stellaceae bacterium]|nr:NAD-dependent epimerase/dehydratase family protein [Stellaceae bacterium]
MAVARREHGAWRIILDAPPQKRGQLSADPPVVILGAGGFIGRALSGRLAARGVPVRAVTRGNTGALSARSDWPALLDGAGIVVHLATAASPRLDRQRFGDEIATAAALGRAAQRCGVARLILMSSIRAMGETSGVQPFRAETAPNPSDEYGRAKLAIEAALAEAPKLAVLRPPLVYGPGVIDSFRMLLSAVARGVPLPVASIRNRRAFIFIDNLLDVIEALFADEAPGGVYLMRDDEEVSTPALVRRIARQLGRAPRLLPCPPPLLQTVLRLAGRGGIAAALIGSLMIDDAATRVRLRWRPRVSLDDGLAATCRWFQEAAR